MAKQLLRHRIQQRLEAPFFLGKNWVPSDQTLVWPTSAGTSGSEGMAIQRQLSPLYAVAPPSTGSATPVMNDASSDKRNSAALVQEHPSRLIS
jgi:hypothetical protein